MAQFAIGFGFLASLPEAHRTLFLGGNGLATGLLLAAIAGAVAALLVVARAVARDNYRMGSLGGTGLTVLVVAVMALIRDIVRDSYLKPYFHPERFVVETQWTVLPLFLAIFLAE